MARLAAYYIVQRVAIDGLNLREITNQMQRLSIELEEFADRGEVHTMMVRYYFHCVRGTLDARMNDCSTLYVDLHFGNEDGDEHEYKPPTRKLKK
jgi:hypothetical protein